MKFQQPKLNRFQAVDAFPVSPGAVDETGSMPFYAEECASMLAVTFSGGDKMMRSIVSTCVPCAPLATLGTARTMLHPL